MNDPAAEPVQSPIPSRNDVHLGPESSRTPDGPGRGGNTERNWLPWIVAIIVVVLIAGLVLLANGHREIETNSGASTIDPYAAHLVLSDVHVSQASNFAGDQLTYVDGTISNQGDRTVTSITVRVLFPNDDGEQPQAEQVPLNLIRTRQPYVDTESVSAAPLKPGSSQDFRLIFDGVSALWNQEVPAVKFQSISTR
jgi:hypothetical protein